MMSPMDRNPVTVGADAIERESATPYYRQLSDILERRLASGEIRPGERLPSESQLCTTFGISRATVRQTLQQMEAGGLVYRVANRGVFAGGRNVQHGWVIQSPEGFLENAFTNQNRSVSTQVVRAGYVQLPAFVCEALGLVQGTRGYELVRVRHLDGQPAVYSINYSPPTVDAIVAGAALALNGETSLSDVLQRAGYRVVGAQRFVRAVSAPQEVADALSIPGSAPVVQIRSTSWRADGTKFDVYETYVRTDVVPLEVSVRAVSTDAH